MSTLSYVFSYIYRLRSFTIKVLLAVWLNIMCFRSGLSTIASLLKLRGRRNPFLCPLWFYVLYTFCIEWITHFTHLAVKLGLEFWRSQFWSLQSFISFLSVYICVFEFMNVYCVCACAHGRENMGWDSQVFQVTDSCWGFL